MGDFFDRISQLCNNEDITITALERVIGASAGVLSRARAKGTDISLKWATAIIENYHSYSADWLLTGKGKMLKNPGDIEKNSNLIPFYDDVASVGGINEISASMGGVYQPSEFIDTGDWFQNATAAIRHYGDSMIEYPSGCILAIKEVTDKSLIVWGKDYVIETSEYRITKRLQSGDDPAHIRAYSTNKETYPDGKLIHEPINIHHDSIARIFFVLGYVVKNGSSIMNFNNSK